VPLIGGMASTGRATGENVLLRNDRAYRSGMVGVSFSGPLAVQTVVSQGCRPIGRPMVITRSHDNIIEQLGGKPALDVLRQAVVELTDEDKRHLSNGLFVGRAISEYRDSWHRGDFLVRNVIGVDEPSGAIGIADFVRPGQTIQFHARDAQTAGEDLTLMLEPQNAADPPAGGLLFSCNGRGSRLFKSPSHDLTAARDHMPATPLAGFFAAGELGPVGGKNFMHGHTASFALFRDTAPGA
jgi:small ligand-binding sensory domain FIST